MLDGKPPFSPADFGTMIHRTLEREASKWTPGMGKVHRQTLDQELAQRQSLGRVWRNKCPHLSVCPKVAYHPTIQAHPALGEPPMLGEYEWRNIPDRKAVNNTIQETASRYFRGLHSKMFLDVETSNDLGFTIMHRGCQTGRHSSGASNMMEIPRRKNTMNKQERNEAVRELDSTEATIAKLHAQSLKLIAADQKKLDALERKLNKRRDALVATRDKVVRPLQRRVTYLRHELAGAF